MTTLAGAAGNFVCIGQKRRGLRGEYALFGQN